jgi:hypothetical protein
MKYVSLLSNVRGGISYDEYMQCASHLYSSVDVCIIQLFPKKKKKKKKKRRHFLAFHINS